MDGVLLSRAVELILAYGFLAIGVFAFLESSMIFPYLPAEVVVPISAGALVTGGPSLVLFVVVTTLGGTLGALFAFAASQKGGEITASRLQGHIRISDRQRQKALERFDKWGEPSILWGRFLPGLRSVVSIPAGISRMPLMKFTAYTAIGTAGFHFSVSAIVYYGHSRALDEALYNSISRSPLEMGLLVTGVCLVTLGGWWATNKWWS